MIVRSVNFFLVGAALLLGLSAYAKPAAEPIDDPFPKGAIVRFGVRHSPLWTGPEVALVPMGFTEFLTPNLTGGIRRYNLSTGQPLKKGICGPGRVVVSGDGKRAVVARPGAIAVVDVAMGKQLLSVQAPDGVVIDGAAGVSLSADGTVLAYSGRGRDGSDQVVVMDVDQNEMLAQVQPVGKSPVFPTLSRNGKTLVTHGPPAPAPTANPVKPPAPPKPRPEADADAARTAQAWDVASGKELFKARATGMGGPVVAAAFSADDQLVAISAAEGPIDLWEVKSGKRLRTLLGRHGQGVRLAFSPDGKTIASVGLDYRIERWATDGKPLGITDPPPGLLVAPITGLAFADNERTIAWMTAAKFAVAWEAPSGKLLSPVKDHAAHIRSIAFGRGQDLLTSGNDGHVFRWDLETGQLSETIAVRPTRIPGQPLVRPALVISADGTLGSWLRTPTQVEVLDMETGDALFCIPAPSSATAAVALSLSYDGMKVTAVSRQADANRPGSCVVWDLATRMRIAEFEAPPNATPAPPAAGLSPDGSQVMIATIAINPNGKQRYLFAAFDTKSGKKLAEVEDPTASGNMGVAPANNSKFVVTSSTGRIWSVDCANERVEKDIDNVPVRGQPPFYAGIVFSPDGKRFATGVVGEPYTTYGVRVYDWEQRKVLHTFIGHAGPVTAIRFSSDGNLLASGSEDTTVLLWDLTKRAVAK